MPFRRYVAAGFDPRKTFQISGKLPPPAPVPEPRKPRPALLRLGGSILLCGLLLLHCRATDAPPPVARDLPPARAPGSEGSPGPGGPAPAPPARREAGAALAAASPGASYPFGAALSPLTDGVLAQLRATAARRPELHADRFVKVGDSITKTPKFLHCFSRLVTRWGDYAALAKAVGYFQKSGFDSFARESLSAENGWSAWQPLAGHEPPLLRELGEVRGRYALLMFGTNDIETSRVSTFFRRMIAMVHTLSEQGVVAIVSTIPERRDKPASGAKVPAFNMAIRGVAQSHDLPLIDLHHALSALPDKGLGSDGIHPSVQRREGRVEACDFDADGLKYGFNLRNLLSIETLERVRAVLEGEAPTDPPPPVLPGIGTLVEPFEIGIPSVSSPRSRAPEENLPSCLAKWQKQPTAAVTTYRLELDGARTLQWLAMDADAGRPLSYWITRAERPQACARAGRGFERIRLGSGRHLIRVVSGGVPHVLGVVASELP